MMEATEPLFAPLSPTATQVAELAEPLGAQDTALTLASGRYVAVVCHVGEVAAAGRGEIWSATMPARAPARSSDSAAMVTTRTVFTRHLRPELRPDQ